MSKHSNPSPDDLDAIQVRADAATEGPWETTASLWPDGSRHDHVTQASDVENDICETQRTPQGIEDAEFIAHARTDVPALLTLVREQQAQLERVRGQLDEWASFIPFPDVEESQRWYSLGKRHAAASIRAALTV